MSVVGLEMRTKRPYRKPFEPIELKPVRILGEDVIRRQLTESIRLEANNNVAAWMAAHGYKFCIDHFREFLRGRRRMPPAVQIALKYKPTVAYVCKE